MTRSSRHESRCRDSLLAREVRTRCAARGATIRDLHRANTFAAFYERTAHGIALSRTSAAPPASTPVEHRRGRQARSTSQPTVAYQAEPALVLRITPYHRADDDTRTLIPSGRADAGDIAVTGTESSVTFALLSSPHRTGVLAARCAQLDALRRASHGLGCTSAIPVRPEIRTVQPTGMSGDLDSET
jgi:hypothetical protein